MSLEAFNRARQVFTALKSSPDYQHGGEDSRGIRIQKASLLDGIAELATNYYPDLESCFAIMSMRRLIEIASEDNGAYVRVAGRDDMININIRGHAGPVPEDKIITEEKLKMAFMRRSGVEVVVNSNGESGIFTRSSYLLAIANGREVSDIINDSLNRFTKEQREELVDKFVDIVAKEVAISGEFLDL